MSTHAAVLAYLRVLAGERPRGKLLEIRYTLSADRMGRRFVPATQLAAAERLISAYAPHTDVYTGVLLRTRRSGTRDAVADSHLVFIEIDNPDGSRQLERFTYTPTMLIASSPGRLHAYWALHDPIGTQQLEEANRTLATHLGGDPASVDAARILRPPSLNHKHRPPVPVELIELEPRRRYRPEDLLSGIPSPPSACHEPPTRATPRGDVDQKLRAIPAREPVPRLAGLEPSRNGKVRCPFHDLSGSRATSDDDSPARSVEDAASAGRASSDPLLFVPAPVYFERLTGLRVGRSGKLHCLFHDDRNPSLHVYPEPGRGWYCFGCGRGGSVYDLAALLFGRKTRGRDFCELRRELAELLL